MGQSSTRHSRPTTELSRTRRVFPVLLDVVVSAARQSRWGKEPCCGNEIATWFDKLTMSGFASRDDKGVRVRSEVYPTPVAPLTPCYTAAVSTQADRPLVGVGVVFVRGGKVFLAQRQGAHGEATWGSAGGHLEFGETLEACARREALEELGVVVGELRVLCLSNIVAYDRHYVDVEFLGDIGDQDPVPQVDDGSFCGSGWFPLRDLPEPLFEPMRLAISSLLSGGWYHAPPGEGAGAARPD